MDDNQQCYKKIPEPNPRNSMRRVASRIRGVVFLAPKNSGFFRAEFDSSPKMSNDLNP